MPCPGTAGGGRHGWGRPAGMAGARRALPAAHRRRAGLRCRRDAGDRAAAGGGARPARLTQRGLPPREQDGLIGWPSGPEETTMPHRRGVLAALGSALGAGKLAFAVALARAQPSSDGTPRMSPEIVSQLAPTGVLRA